jgi:hypothetical protein
METSQFTFLFNQNATSWEGYAYCVLGFSGVPLAHFQKCGDNVNSALYCEVLLKLRNTIRGKRPG